MTTPDARKTVEREVQAMLARATPAQLARLLADVMTAPAVAKEPVKYDA
ncbi:hypothetical protein SAMN05421665_2838 [Yoonia rosea]|uniref:Uncharacterized protein n=1 Tax=Yoonia rosea TaxID=287098 RepID=A0A1R3XCA5_9RHOB|nr:hypothetical protein [Yoonia rosea]SIT88950.1 hypothetical protein SAMN05421665_2838 [Yoonia rosea]